ncbi:MAG: hypothetical protein AB7G25_07655 [Sphingomonadaceae bacterium]
MPIKRRASKHRDHRITPAAVEAYHSRDWLGLHRALGLKPWQCSPLDADDGPCPHNGAWAEDWEMIQGLRRELEAANAG